MLGLQILHTIAGVEPDFATQGKYLSFGTFQYGSVAAFHTEC